MARAKRASDEIYNARRRAKRLIARLEREQVKGALGKSARADYIRSLNEQIAASYQGMARDSAQVSEAKARASAAAKSLDRMTRVPRATKTAADRENKIFARQINLARSGAPSSLGAHGEKAVGVFYAATRRLWQGKDPTRRNELILEGLGVSSLPEAYKIVLKSNVKAFRAAVGASAPDSTVLGITSENADFYSEVDFDSDLLGSPIWAGFVNMV